MIASLGKSKGSQECVLPTLPYTVTSYGAVLFGPVPPSPFFASLGESLEVLPKLAPACIPLLTPYVDALMPRRASTFAGTSGNLQLHATKRTKLRPITNVKIRS